MVDGSCSPPAASRDDGEGVAFIQVQVDRSGGADGSGSCLRWCGAVLAGSGMMSWALWPGSVCWRAERRDDQQDTLAICALTWA